MREYECEGRFVNNGGRIAVGECGSCGVDMLDVLLNYDCMCLTGSLWGDSVTLGTLPLRVKVK